jgi:ribosomal protein S18 acetylase RimI-like enzyme
MFRKPKLTFRPFAQADLDFAYRQTTREGWLSSRACLLGIIEHDPDGCFIAEWKGEAIGMVTATCFGKCGWVGNLIIEPVHRNQGHGTALLDRALGYLDKKGIETIWLEADPPGMGIYQRLGFIREFDSLRFICARPPEQRGVPVLPLAREDLPDVCAFDREHFGDDRGRFLGYLHDRAVSSFLLHTEGRVAGYLMLLPAGEGLRIGPFVAHDSHAASRLMSAALTQCQSKALSAGVPKPNREGIELFLSLGFEGRSPSVRMVRGDRHSLGDQARIFAIASGATG